RLFRNNIDRANLAPFAPASLTTELLPDNDVRLRWDATGDDRTAGAGLRYNLRVGTNSGGAQIVTAHANLTNGFRRVLETVSAGLGQEWQLRDLPRGDYFWSVQAIDAGLAGSVFAPEATFSITNERPAILSTLADVHTAPNVPTPAL